MSRFGSHAQPNFSAIENALKEEFIENPLGCLRSHLALRTNRSDYSPLQQTPGKGYAGRAKWALRLPGAEREYDAWIIVMRPGDGSGNIPAAPEYASLDPSLADYQVPRDKRNTDGSLNLEVAIALGSIWQNDLFTPGVISLAEKHVTNGRIETVALGDIEPARRALVKSSRRPFYAATLPFAYITQQPSSGFGSIHAIVSPKAPADNLLAEQFGVVTPRTVPRFQAVAFFQVPSTDTDALHIAQQLQYRSAKFESK